LLLAAAPLYFVLRQAAARQEIKKELQTSMLTAPQLQSTSRLEILPLYEEAAAGDGLLNGHGVSYLIRSDSSTILMDLGNNPDEMQELPLTLNMQPLGIDPQEIEAVFISPAHPDQVGGVVAWKAKSLADLPEGLVGLPLYLPEGTSYPGGQNHSEPFLLGSDAASSGVIPYPEVFPLSLYAARGAEQALVYDVEGKGLVLITGCGHPGLELLAERVEELYGKTVIGVVGGLHYEKENLKDLEPHIYFLLSRRPELVALSPHDSSPQALEAFRSAFGASFHLLQVGDSIQFP
jgi:7,8-dihydropterin-6-yl-methyl-4-(beta-D-ribofuranosyl)aminobenzene 5'-phosphate synthase